MGDRQWGGGVDRAQRFDEAGNLVGTPIVFNNNPTTDIDAATYSDGRAILTTHDVISGNDVVSSIWDSRITDANQVSGANFIGPGGGPGDLLIIANHNGQRTAEVAPSGQVIAIVGSNISFDGAADFNNDGLSDLLARSDNLATAERTLFAYKMTPVGFSDTTVIATLTANWITDAFGDFNGDGTSDILLHRDAGGVRTFEVLSINNYAVQSAPIVQVTGLDWFVDGTGDFNANGTSDILEHRIVGGTMNLQVVTMNNNVVQSVSLLANIGSDWQIDGTGDFNHDGTSDILMHRDSSNGVRTLEVLTIQNNAIQSGTIIAQVGTNISVDGVGDFNSDGTSDIALHQDVGTTRTDLIFNVVNNTVVNPHTVAVTGIDWHVS
jgi:FG-GAP-like repeat